MNHERCELGGDSRQGLAGSARLEGRSTVASREWRRQTTAGNPGCAQVSDAVALECLICCTSAAVKAAADKLLLFIKKEIQTKTPTNL